MISNPIPWPNGARCAVSLTWDMDADSGLNWYNKERADQLIASQSMCRYGPRIAVPRLVEMGRRYGIKQTFFVPGWCIEKYPDPVGLMLEHGNEVSLHGYIHERPNELSKDDELYWLQRGHQAFIKFVGKRSRGWRAPSFAFSKHSLDYLLDEGIEYDSSLMGDDLPYVLRSGRRTLIELPTQWVNDDWPHYMYSRDFSHIMQISTPGRVLELFKSEFDAAWEFGALWVSVWHPFVSGRPARYKAVTELIEYMQRKGGVWFARLDEIADHARALIAEGKWTPRAESLPLYHSPIPELSREKAKAPVRAAASRASSPAARARARRAR